MKFAVTGHKKGELLIKVTA